MVLLILKLIGKAQAGLSGRNLLVSQICQQAVCHAKFSLALKTGVFVLTLLCFPACTSQDQKAENVILLSLDQLDAGRLHCYGNPRETSPNIDRLAQGGVRLSRFYSVAPWTSPTYATMMTGLFPSRHGSTVFSFEKVPMMPPIDENTPVLAEVFKSRGYRTVAFVNNALGGRGLTDRGFDEYYQYQQPTAPVSIVEREGEAELGANRQHRAPQTMERLLPWLDQHASEPFFAFVLFWEPHSPYNPPPEHDLFKSDAYPNMTDTGYDIKEGYLKRLAMLGDEKAVERLYQLYDGKIHYIDSFVGQLMDHLEKLGLEKKTLIVLTSDHGEMMFSHPDDFLTFDHVSLYDPTLHVPLILSGPASLPKGKVIEALSSTLDIAPTILDLAGLPPLPGAQGQSLVPLIEGKVKSLNPYVYAEEDITVPLRSIRNESYKLIYNMWDGQKQLFDLGSDPGELNDIAEQNPQVVDKLFSRLEAWMKENHLPKEELLEHWKTYTPRELVVDEQTIEAMLQLTGAGWHSDETPESGHHEGGCFWTESGDGSRTAIWRGDTPLVGAFKISVFYGKLPQGPVATNAPFTVTTDSGPQPTVRLNFKKNVGKWNLLGTYENPRTVTLTNSANGSIIVDAVKFERVE